MTLTSLAQKHNIDPESAKVFLREFLDMQPVHCGIKHPPNGIDLSKGLQIGSEIIFGDYTIQQLLNGGYIPLIARPTDLGE